MYSTISAFMQIFKKLRYLHHYIFFFATLSTFMQIFKKLHYLHHYNFFMALSQILPACRYLKNYITCIIINFLFAILSANR